MYSVFERIDQSILHKIFQKISNFWTDVTGYSSFRLAILVGLAYLLLLSVTTVLSVLFGKLSVTLGLLSGFLLAGLVLPWLFRQMLNREKDLTSRAMNPIAEFWPYGMLRLTYAVLVVFALMSSWKAVHATPIDWSEALSGFCAFLWWCMMYLASCTPKPPSVVKAGNTLAANSI